MAGVVFVQNNRTSVHLPMFTKTHSLVPAPCFFLVPFGGSFPFGVWRSYRQKKEERECICYISSVRKMAVDIRTVCILHTDVDIVIQTVIQTVGIYHTDVQTVDI